MRLATCLTLVFVTVLASRAPLAQPAYSVLDERGEIVPATDVNESEFVPGVLLVRFRAGALNEDALNSRDVTLDIQTAIKLPATARAFRSLGAVQMRRVVSRLRPEHRFSEARSGEIIQMPDLWNLMKVQLPPTVDVVQAAAALSEVGGIEYAEPDYVHRVDSRVDDPGVPFARSALPLGLLSPPNDQFYNQQLYLEQGTDVDIDAERAWDFSVGSYSVKVGVIDTGIDYDHPDLGGGAFGYQGAKVRGGWDWYNDDSDPDDADPGSHGTKVAGVIGAFRNNGTGVAGLAGGNGSGNQGVQLFAFKVGETDSFPTSNVIDALIEGSSASPGFGYGCDVINYSGGSYNYSESYRSALRVVAQNGTVLAVSKGNDNTDDQHYPSDYDGPWVLSVGASDFGDDLSSFSNFGNGMDVLAPSRTVFGQGSLVYTTSTVEQGSYAGFSGTSAAAPQVAGLAALLLTERSDLHPEEVEGIIRSSADNVEAMNGAEYTDRHGDGRINAGRALEMLNAPFVLRRKTAAGGSVVGSTGTYTAALYNPGGGLGTGVYQVKRYEVQRTVSLSDYTAAPEVFCRGTNATTGWSAASPNHQTGYCEVVSSSQTSAVLRTYVYQVWSMSGSYIGYRPSSPSGARFAYTEIGIPTPTPPLTASISGPGVLGWKQQGTFTANYSGGSGTPSYLWYTRSPGASTWNSTGVTAQTYSFLMTYTSGIELRVRVKRGGETVYATKSVQYCGGGPCLLSARTSLAPAEEVPTEVTLHPPSPNPVRGPVEFGYGLPEASGVRLALFDVAGREVAVVENVGERGAGSHRASFDLGALPAGLYLARLEAGGTVSTQQITVIR